MIFSLRPQSSNVPAIFREKPISEFHRIQIVGNHAPRIDPAPTLLNSTCCQINQESAEWIYINIYIYLDQYNPILTQSYKIEKFNSPRVQLEKKAPKSIQSNRLGHCQNIDTPNTFTGILNRIDWNNCVNTLQKCVNLPGPQISVSTRRPRNRDSQVYTQSISSESR